MTGGYGGTGSGFGPGFYGVGLPPMSMTREQKLEWERDEMRRRLNTLTEGNPRPIAIATILDVDEDEVTAVHGGQTSVMRNPKIAGLEPGVSVRFHTGNGQILHVTKTPKAVGQVAIVKDVIDEKSLVVTFQNMDRSVVYHGEAPQPGERVVLDITASAVLRNLGNLSQELALSVETKTAWDDVIGQDAAKRAMREAIEEPVTHASIYARYGKPRCKGVVLYGPPGVGKTLIGRAAATALAKLHGKSARSGGFQYVKGPELLNKFVGNSEASVRALFDGSREHYAKHGYAAIIFIDEADAVLGARGVRRGIEGLERTMVPAFLAEMDGLEDSGAFVILATNRPQDLDPAVMREGRVDRKVLVGRPDQQATQELFGHYLDGKPLHGSGVGPMAAAAAAEMFAPAHALWTVRCKDGNDKRFALSHVASGAMVAGIVEKAIQSAIRRDIASGAKKPGGVTLDDVKAAIAATCEEQRGVGQDEALADFCEPFKDQVTRIDRVRGAESKGEKAAESTEKAS